MKVAWFDTEEWEREYIGEKETGFEVDFFEESLEPGTVGKAQGYDAVSVFVSSEVNEEVLESLECNIIACRSTGYDHVDIEKAAEKGIKVCNVPDYGGTTVAEHTFGLILSISRRIHRAIEKVEEGDFDHQGLRCFDLKGKKIGVIGTGTIGKNVIRIANGFDMDVVAYDAYPDRELAHRMGFMYLDLEDLLRDADIVSLHCPLTEDTRYLIGKEEMKIMDGSILVNTARGELVDTESLIEALEKDNLKAAGLDTLEEECYIEDDIKYLSQLEDKCDPKIILEDHILMDRDDVIVTPHNAFNSREALERIEDTTVENIERTGNVVNSPWR